MMPPLQLRFLTTVFHARDYRRVREPPETVTELPKALRICEVVCV